jgi:hypothetical protein
MRFCLRSSGLWLVVLALRLLVTILTLHTLAASQRWSKCPCARTVGRLHCPRVSHDLHDPRSYLSNAGKGEDGEGEGLHLFEQAMLANLCPDNAEEAISFIPRWVSGHGRCTQTPSFCPGCRVHRVSAVSSTLPKACFFAGCLVAANQIGTPTVHWLELDCSSRLDSPTSLTCAVPFDCSLNAFSLTLFLKPLCTIASFVGRFVLHYHTAAAFG